MLALIIPIWFSKFQILIVRLCDCVIVWLCDCVWLCLIVIATWVVVAIFSKSPYWLCNNVVISWEYFQNFDIDCAIVQKLAFWLCDCAKICILIVRLCENLHFDCAIVRLCMIVLDCADCVWLCGLPWAKTLHQSNIHSVHMMYRITIVRTYLLIQLEEFRLEKHDGFGIISELSSKIPLPSTPLTIFRPEKLTNTKKCYPTWALYLISFRSWNFKDGGS